MFKSGKSLFIFPLKVLYSFDDEQPTTLKGGVAVSSRSFKKAVHRNRVKRVLREAYRLHKQPLEQLLAEQKKKLVIFFIYTSKDLPVYKEVAEKMTLVLQKLIDQLKKQQEKS